MKKEYNLLTQRLLAEGYTAENYPDYVRVPPGAWDKNDPLHNLHDGFEYTPDYRNRMVFKTGCGLMVKGSHFSNGSMSTMGITWIPENDNPTITCPYRKDSCDLRNQLLGGVHGGGLCKMLFCDCHQTSEAYDYEKSIDKVTDDYNAEKHRKYDEFCERKKGHVCHWHMNYNEWTGEWNQMYDPMTCARMCMKKAGQDCDLTHKPVSRKRGNVFYDVKVTRIRNDGTLFDGEKVIEITKGVRLFDKNVSLTICEQVAKRCIKEITEKEMQRRYSEIRLCGTEVEVLNIRAEQRESRDLIQDLIDIQEGIKIVHDSDMKKRAKEEKRERRKLEQEKKIAKLEKRILEVGYRNLESYSTDRVHADKWLGEERIAELEEMREQQEKEKQNEPVQMNLFDFMEDAQRGEESKK